ncbi:MAG: hypothetical protein NTX03_02885 [Bacteroidetes bacterium]|nr:hypothetical protein [Bacteroidota bacterium]
MKKLISIFFLFSVFCNWLDAQKVSTENRFEIHHKNVPFSLYWAGKKIKDGDSIAVTQKEIKEMLAKSKVISVYSNSDTLTRYSVNKFTIMILPVDHKKNIQIQCRDLVNIIPKFWQGELEQLVPGDAFFISEIHTKMETPPMKNGAIFRVIEDKEKLNNVYPPPKIKP